MCLDTLGACKRGVSAIRKLPQIENANLECAVRPIRPHHDARWRCFCLDGFADVDDKNAATGRVVVV